MKKRLLIAITFVAATGSVMAFPPPPPDSNNNSPIDGGILLLAAAGAAYGGYQFKQKRKNA